MQRVYLSIAAGTKLLQPLTKTSLQPPRHNHFLVRCCSTMSSGTGLASTLWNRHRSQSMMALYHPFVVSLAAGVLDISSFRHYVAQDAFFLQAFSTAYQFVRDNVDDEMSKLAVNHLLQAVMDELGLHSSYAQAWGMDLSILSQPNKATSKYIEFLLATARGGESTSVETTSSDRQRAAALTVGAMTPCMRLYAFLGQEIIKHKDECLENPYHEWINTYSSKAFESSTLKIEHLLETLAARVGEDEKSKLGSLYSQALTLELEFFSAQPNCQCALLPFIRRQIDGSDASYLLMMDFDLTCSVTDSSSALASISIQETTEKFEDDNPRTHYISTLELKKRWELLERSYSEQYCQVSMPPERQENCGRYFDSDGLRAFLGQLSDFEIQANAEVVKQQVFRGLNLDKVRSAGRNMVFQEGCADFLRQVSLYANVSAHIISVCWSRSFIEGALSKEEVDYVQVHANELVTSGPCTTGDIKRVVETPLDKERVFEDLMGSAKVSRCIYVGDSVTDLLCLLKADVGIVIGANSTLERVARAFGVSMVPMYKGVLNMVKRGSLQGRKCVGTIYTATDWHEIHAFLLAAPEFSTKIVS